MKSLEVGDCAQTHAAFLVYMDLVEGEFQTFNICLPVFDAEASISPDMHVCLFYSCNLIHLFVLSISICPICMSVLFHIHFNLVNSKSVSYIFISFQETYNVEDLNHISYHTISTTTKKRHV